MVSKLKMVSDASAINYDVDLSQYSKVVKNLIKTSEDNGVNYYELKLREKCTLKSWFKTWTSWLPEIATPNNVVTGGPIYICSPKKEDLLAFRRQICYAQGYSKAEYEEEFF